MFWDCKSAISKSYKAFFFFFLCEWSSWHNGEIPRIFTPLAQSFHQNARGLIEDGGERVCKPTVDSFVSFKGWKKSQWKKPKVTKGWHFEDRSIHTVQYFRIWKYKSVFSVPHKTHWFSDVQAFSSVPCSQETSAALKFRRGNFVLGMKCTRKENLKRRFRKRS